MNETEVRQRVEVVIQNQTGFDGTDLDERLRAFDEFDYMQLACELQEEFEVEISDAELEKRKSVDAVYGYVSFLLQ